MLSRRKGAKPCSRCRMSCESNRRIFCINPTKQRAAFFGIGSYKCNSGRRRQKRDRSRVNNLEDIKTQCVSHQRQHPESRAHRPSRSRAIPTEKKGSGCTVTTDPFTLACI